MSDDKLDKCLEGIHRLELQMTKLVSEVEINTDDLAEHIKRTELLETKLGRIYQFMLIGLGILIAEFGPDLIKILGAL
jgi:hypothetical protein